jgi:flagellar motility protein MotE (MotC chaperone)
MKHAIVSLLSMVVVGCHLVEAAESVDETPQEPAESEEAKEEEPSELPLPRALAQRRAELDRREAEIEQAAVDLEAARTEVDEKLERLEARLEELKRVRDDIATKKQQKEVERLLQLVETAERMKPEAAARYLDEFDMETAKDILHGMKIRKAAEVISNMNPSRAAKMSRRFLMNGHPSPPSERESER